MRRAVDLVLAVEAFQKMGNELMEHSVDPRFLFPGAAFGILYLFFFSFFIGRRPACAVALIWNHSGSLKPLFFRCRPTSDDYSRRACAYVL